MLETDPEFYDFDGHPISLTEWGELFHDFAARQIANTEIGDVRISTVWLGLDHRYRGLGETGPPLIFETMVFGGDTDDEYMQRYPTREAALAGHDQTVAMVRDPARAV